MNAAEIKFLMKAAFDAANLAGLPYGGPACGWIMLCLHDSTHEALVACARMPPNEKWNEAARYLAQLEAMETADTVPPHELAKAAAP